MSTDTRPSWFRALTVSDGIRAAAGRDPGKVALSCAENKLTYAQLVDRMDRVANAAHSGLGLQKGEHAAVLANNRIEYPELLAGLGAAGLATATLSARSTPEEVRFICEDSEARVLFLDPDLASLAEAGQLGPDITVISLGDPYEAWLADAHGSAPDVRVEEWDPFCIPYTAGTTGTPKGVLISHRSRTVNYFAMSVEYGCYGPDDRALAVAPLYHGAGLSFALAPIFFGGYCEILPHFDPELVLERLSSQRMTNVFMVPTHFQGIFSLNEQTRAKLRPDSLATIISNAAPLSQAMKERIVDYFGEDLLYECYGGTEMGVISNLRPPDQLRKQQCVGLPFPFGEVRILDDNGNPAKHGEIGEIQTRSPYLFNEYWKRPEQTAAAIVDGGWYRTGDLGRQDDEGYLYLVDRKNDLIISGGINVYPREIEEILVRLPAVLETAVYGVEHERWGEAVEAAIVLRPGATATATEIQEACSGIARYKIPKTVRFIDALPRNAAGKVMRRTLRDQAAAAPVTT